ncbi:MAG: hypothetical protein JNL97_07955 [Verrucomicrobiales bacterium]|nr:hypothetical protein [Verrucomicrobiales bacterium]
MYSTPSHDTPDALNSTQTLLHGPARPGEPSTPLTLTAFTVEEPAFSGNQGFLPPTSSPTAGILHIRVPETPPMESRIPATALRRNDCIPVPLVAQTRSFPRFLSLLLFAGLIGFGYFTSTRSLATLQSAWRLTDTLRPKSGNGGPTRYAFENAEIPGPYENGSSLWDALRKHLHLPSPTVPSRHYRY